MPLNFLASVATEGSSAIPHYEFFKKWLPWSVLGMGVKYYFAGATNTWDRNMHGRVALVTGGTSGLGAAVVRQLASQGTQIVLLVRKLNDGWLEEYIQMLRDETGNPCIYAEEADLANLHSVRTFATKWIDNVPPRRLDMVVCCAAVAQPPFLARQASVDGLELQTQVNYLAHYHLLTLLAPAIRSQPPDRDVRIVLTTCVAGVMGQLDLQDLAFSDRAYPTNAPYKVLGASKLALSLFAYEFQRQNLSYQRSDKAPPLVHVAVVDPGMMRSPSFKRFFSCGSIFGLLIYILLWPIWFFLLKTSRQGAQSIFFALTNPDIEYMTEVAYISECRMRNKPPRKEFEDEEFQKQLFDSTAKLIEVTEKKSASARNQAKATGAKKSETEPKLKKR